MEKDKGNWKEKIKNRSPEERKAILVYTIELAVFAVLFIVLGVLEFLGIIGNNMGWRLAFTYITLVGAAVFIAFLIWSLASPKRRAKSPLFDRLIMVPGPIAVVVLDIISLIKGVENVNELHRIIIGTVFVYFGAAYIAQAIYHFIVPHPMILEALREAEEKEVAEAEKAEPEMIEAPSTEPVELEASEGEKDPVQEPKDTDQQ